MSDNNILDLSKNKFVKGNDKNTLKENGSNPEEMKIINEGIIADTSTEEFNPSNESKNSCSENSQISIEIGINMKKKGEILTNENSSEEENYSIKKEINCEKKIEGEKKISEDNDSIKNTQESRENIDIREEKNYFPDDVKYEYIQALCYCNYDLENITKDEINDKSRENTDNREDKNYYNINKFDDIYPEEVKYEYIQALCYFNYDLENITKKEINEDNRETIDNYSNNNINKYDDIYPEDVKYEYIQALYYYNYDLENITKNEINDESKENIDIREDKNNSIYFQNKYYDIYPEDVKYEYIQTFYYGNYDLENITKNEIINGENDEKANIFENGQKDKDIKDNNKIEKDGAYNGKIIKETYEKKKAKSIINNNQKKKEANDLFYDGYYLKDPLIKKKYDDPNIIGLRNIGHTCYMNSFLQILLHLPNLVNDLKEFVTENNVSIKLIDNIINLSDDRDNIKYLKKIKYLMGEVNPEYGQYVQNDSQMFGIDLINEMIISLKDEKKLNDSNELLIESEIKEEINLNNFEKYKNILFKEYKEDYNHKEEDEICLEKMFQFHEYTIKVKTKENEIINLEKCDFETFLNIPLIISEYRNEWNIIDLLKAKYAFFQFPKKKENIIKNDINISEDEELKIMTKHDKNNIITNNENKNYSFIYFTKKIINYLKQFFIESKDNSKDNSQDNSQDNSKDINNDKVKMKKNNYIKFRRLASLPKILIISINRAILGKKFNLDRLKYNDDLDMGPFIDKDLLGNNKSTKYKLFAVNECIGSTRLSGHCFSYIKLDNDWYKFNDDYVCKDSPNYSSNYVVGLYYIQK